MSKTKIAISGIGAVGGYYGGLLAARYKDSEDIDIYFISRGENLKEIRENGIEVKNTFLTIKAKPTLATDNPAEIGPVDYLFCWGFLTTEEHPVFYGELFHSSRSDQAGTDVNASFPNLVVR